MIIVFAVIVLIIFSFMAVQVLKAPFLDEKTNRFYRYNPHHADCPECGASSPLIRTITEPHQTGVYCEKCGVVWMQ